MVSEKMNIRSTIGWLLLLVGIVEWTFLTYGTLMNGWDMLLGTPHTQSVRWLAYSCTALPLLLGALLILGPERKHN